MVCVFVNIKKMEREKDVKSLIDLIGSKDCYIQEWARQALVRVGNFAVGELTLSLRNFNNPTARWRSAEVLGEIGDISAIPHLIKALEDDVSAVTWRALEALVEMGTPAIPPLQKATKSPDPDVVWCAKKALSHILKNVELERMEYIQKILYEIDPIVEHIDDAWYWQLIDRCMTPQTYLPRIAIG